MEQLGAIAPMILLFGIVIFAAVYFLKKRSQRLTRKTRQSPQYIQNGDVHTETGQVYHQTGMNYCPNCGSKIGGDTKFCPACGHRLIAQDKVPTPYCPACGSNMGEGNLYCPQCGVKIAEGKLSEPVIRERKAKAGHSVGFHFLIAFLVILGLGGIYFAVASSGILTPKPKPVIVSSTAYETAPNNDYTIIIRAEVRNSGGDGDVQLIANLNTFGQSLRKSKVIYLGAGETRTVEIAFPEVTIEPRLLEAILDFLTGGGVRVITNPDFDFDVWAEPAR